MSYEIKRSRAGGSGWPLGTSIAVRLSDHYPGHIPPDKPTRFLMTPGIDFGGQAGHPRVVSEPVACRFYIVVCPGTTQWSSVGATSYHPAEYELLEAVAGVWVKHASVRPGKLWRKAVKELEALALELAKEGD